MSEAEPTTARELYRFWIGAIHQQQKNLKDYYRTADRIEGRYREEHHTDTYRRAHGSDEETSYNLFYSNTQTMLPLLYNRTPIVNVQNSGNRSRMARKASRLLEDAIHAQVELDGQFNDKMEDITQDYTVVGQGTSRVLYEPITVEETDENGFTSMQTVFEEVSMGYLRYDEVLFIGSNRWEKLPGIAFGGTFTKAELEVQFPGKDIQVTMVTEDLPKRFRNKKKDDIPDRYKRATVWEVWDKERREVYFISEGFKDKLIEKKPDPLKLKDFYPIPKPAWSIKTSKTLIPVPFFIYYQDQQRELDILSTRIERLTEELRFRGAYNNSAAGAEDIYYGGDGEMTPITDMEQFTKEGGINGIFFTIPLAELAATITELQKNREVVIQNIHQITGLADILRGQTDPRETLGAQELKGKFGTLRISRLQKEIQRYARDIYRIMGEIIIRKFEDSTIAISTGRTSEKEFKEVQEIMAFLRGQIDFGISIDIETDSTISANEETAQDDAVEFAQVMEGLASQLQIFAQIFGEEWVEVYVKEQLKAFNQSRALDDALQNRLDELKQQANQPQEPEPPTKEEVDIMKVQAQAQKDAADNQLALARLEIDKVKLMFEAEKAGIEIETEQTELAFKKTQSVIDNQIKLAEVEQKAIIAAEKLKIEKEKLAVEAANPLDNAVAG